MIRTPEFDDFNKRMMARSIIENSLYSFSEKCKRLYKCKEQES